VRGFGSREEALGPCELHRLSKAFVLLVGARLNHAFVHQEAERWGVAVVAETARVDPVGHEAVAESEHLHDRAEADRVAEVVRNAKEGVKRLTRHPRT
jgi:hypothetical protein